MSRARPTPPNPSARHCGRDRPILDGPKPLRHNRYRASAPQASSCRITARCRPRSIRSNGERFGLSATVCPDSPSSTASMSRRPAVYALSPKVTASTTAISILSVRRCGSSWSWGPVTEATVAAPRRCGGSCGSDPARAQAVEEWAAHQYPDGLAQAGDVVDRLGERQPDVVVAVFVLHPQLHAVAVQAQRSDPPG